MLEEQFGIPIFINNDGDLFVYGEAIAGFLPYVNGLLEKAGSPKRYKNLFGVTLGTGFGGGIVRNGELFIGDNSMAGEVWLLRNKLHPEMNAEEGASIRAVRRVYAEKAGIPFEQAPEPKDIFDIGTGAKPGDQAAAGEAFRRLGEVVGDAMAQALTLVDGLAVIGGGISGAAPLFLPALVDELNGTYTSPKGEQVPPAGRGRLQPGRPGATEDVPQGRDARRSPCPAARRKCNTIRCSASASACRASAPAKPWPSAPTPSRCESWMGADQNSIASSRGLASLVKRIHSNRPSAA